MSTNSGFTMTTLQPSHRLYPTSTALMQSVSHSGRAQINGSPLFSSFLPHFILSWEPQKNLPRRCKEGMSQKNRDGLRISALTQKNSQSPLSDPRMSGLKIGWIRLRGSENVFFRNVDKTSVLILMQYQEEALSKPFVPFTVGDITFGLSA